MNFPLSMVLFTLPTFMSSLSKAAAFATCAAFMCPQCLHRIQLAT